MTEVAALSAAGQGFGGRRAYLIKGTHPVATPSDATELVRHWLVPAVGELRAPRPARREVTLEGPRLVVVVRHQALPVDRSLVQRVAAVAADRSATGLVFSTRGFSRNAVHAATSGSVLLFGVRPADGALVPMHDTGLRFLTRFRPGPQLRAADSPRRLEAHADADASEIPTARPQGLQLELGLGLVPRLET